MGGGGEQWCMEGGVATAGCAVFETRAGQLIVESNVFGSKTLVHPPRTPHHPAPRTTALPARGPPNATRAPRPAPRAPLPAPRAPRPSRRACVCACMHACVHACMHACVKGERERARARARARVCVR